MRKGIIVVFITFYCIINDFSLFADSANTIYLKSDTTLEYFNEEILYFIDSTNIFNQSDLSDETFNRRFKDNFDNKYHDEGSIWARFFIQNNRVKKSSYILEVGGDKEVIVFYKPVHALEYESEFTGKFVPYPKNELGNFHFKNNKVRLDLSPQTKYEVVVFYPNEANEDVRPVFRIYSVNNWYTDIYRYDSKRNLWLGLFYGICIVLSIINFIYYFIHKDKAYINYAFYILTVFYYEASAYGQLDYPIFYKNPALYSGLENISLIVFVIAYLLFLKSFINTKKRFPGWNKVANYIIGALLLNVLIGFVFVFIYKLPHTAMIYRNIMLLCTLPFAAAFLYFIYLKGNKVDHTFILGSSVLVATGLIGLVTSTFFLYRNADLIFQVGVILELVIFSIGLGVKSRFHEMEKISAQESLIDQLKENEILQISVNRELENKVRERTAEIQSQNEELASQRDSLEAQNTVIARSMKELESMKTQLVEIVEERTQQLQNANEELLKHNSQLEQYAFITAHNLRAPVARLKGLVFILEKSAGINKQNKEIIKKIINSALEMDEVLTDMNEILEIKIKDIGQTETVNLYQTIDKVKKILADNIKESNADVRLRIDISELTVYEPYLESIIYNLVSNSIKYRSQDRRLQIDIETYQESSNVILKISDNGMGIDLKQHEGKIFGLYRRFHDHVAGKGLGLYLVKTQVESLGGMINIESQLGEGTCFIITLPHK